jgi:hypothetical protein
VLVAMLEHFHAAKKSPWRFWNKLGDLRELGGSKKQHPRGDYQNLLWAANRIFSINWGVGLPHFPLLFEKILQIKGGRKWFLIIDFSVLLANGPGPV